MKVENVKVYGLENAVRCSKFPMQTDTSLCTTEVTKTTDKLAMCGLGEAHDNFLNGIIVQFDLTFSNKAWVELQRYHFIDFISSQSTMHRITKFNLDEAYNEYVDQRVIDIMKELVAEYNSKDLADRTAEDYLRILYSNPAGFELTAGMTTNYRQLKTIYRQRKSHRLPEWREFCNWIKKLPYSDWITGENNE
jgi:hypothetical protein